MRWVVCQLVLLALVGCRSSTPDESECQRAPDVDPTSFGCGHAELPWDCLVCPDCSDMDSPATLVWPPSCGCPAPTRCGVDAGLDGPRPPSRRTCQPTLEVTEVCFPRNGIREETTATLQVRHPSVCYERWAPSSGCSIDVVGDHRLSLEIETCGEGIFRSCEAPDPTYCSLPMLEAGEWEVELRGEVVARFDVASSDAAIEPLRNHCVGVHEVGCGEPTIVGVQRACHAPRVSTREQTISLTVQGCGCDLRPGPCEVRVGAEDIWVSPAMVDCSEPCDVAVCGSYELSCTAYVDGGRYEVHYAGTDATTTIARFGLDDEPVTCTEL